MSEEMEFQSLPIAGDEAAQYLNNLSDEMLSTFSFPLFSATSAIARSTEIVDEDGFPNVNQNYLWDLHKLQEQCWNKAEKNPWINSHVRDIMGRMAGWGFEFYSKIPDLQKTIDEIVDDPRNDVYQNMPKFCARAEIEGELFLMFTLHKNGFVEIDFLSPSMIRNGGDDGSGIIFHPTKQSFPLFYYTNFPNQHNASGTEQALIPSINVCYFPDLEKEARDHPAYDSTKLKYAKARKSNTHPYDKTNGYFRFIVHWNKGFMTKRNVSHIKTTIEWVNYYESLKKYEIDHKKSSGAYLWVIEMEDVRAFRRWLQLSEEDRKKTGIMQPKDPGGTLVLPPGMRLNVQNPKLSSISDEDTDIMQMVSSGLQKPQDTMLGDYRSTYASVKASQGPQGDRINDELHYFKLFLIYDFWRPICYLRSLARDDFKYKRRVKEAVDFDENKNPIMENVQKPVYKLIDICLPMSRLEDIESIAKALLGSKHASVVDTLGIPREKVARRLGFNNYIALRKEKAAEDENLPNTLSAFDQESVQEKEEGEPKGSPSDKQE